MKFSFIFCLLFWSSQAVSQCPVLDQINDSVDFEGIYVHYVQQDSQVHVFYGNNEFNRKLPYQLSFSCSTKYLPSIPHPVWRNDDFIEFRRGCGSMCFDTWLAPLHNSDSVREGGDVVVDKSRAIYMTLERESNSRKPYLELLNGYTRQTEKTYLPSSQIFCAIPLEQLHRSAQHPNGFLLEDDLLTVFLATESGKRVLKKRVRIEW